MCFPPGRAPLLWKQQAELQTQRPITRFVRVFDIVKCLNDSIKGLMAHVEDLPAAAADRNCPLISRCCLPVGRYDRRTRQIPAMAKIIVNEGFDQKLADACAILFPSEGHNVGDERADQPMALNCQSRRGNPSTVFAPPEASVRGAGERE